MKILHRKVLALFIIIVCDSILTVYLIIKGWGEANPIMNWYIQLTDVTWMAITKIVISFILLLMIHKRDEASRQLDWVIPLYIFLLVGGIMFQFVWIEFNL